MNRPSFTPWRLVPALLGVLLTGCAALYGTKASPEDVRALLELQNARGCIYFRGAALPWADVTMHVIGTWGSNPPTYEECFKSLPR